MRKILDKIINSGLKEGYQLWEIQLSRKMNSVLLIAIPNMTAGIVFYSIMGYSQLLLDCVFGLVALLIVFAINIFKNSLWATYWFFCYGFCFFILPLNFQMGMGSYMILFYFPLIISMVQLLGRSETFKHLIALSGVCMLSIVATALGYKFNVINPLLNKESVSTVAAFNIILSVVVTLTFTIVIVSESVSQEKLIRKILREKEILLAEVFHRVKNNMTIVTSLLNLKKNMSDSPEVQSALEDCRNRVFSMALVHQKIFNNENIIGLDFKDYIEQLVNELVEAISQKEMVDVAIQAEDVIMELSNAIPCGLILNELITNALKHAQEANKKLRIQILLKKETNTIELEVKDNGPGINEELANSKQTLGLELIRSLSEQISGTYSFYNNNGSCFNLKFKQ